MSAKNNSESDSESEYYVGYKKNRKEKKLQVMLHNVMSAKKIKP